MIDRIVLYIPVVYLAGGSSGHGDKKQGNASISITRDDVRSRVERVAASRRTGRRGSMSQTSEAACYSSHDKALRGSRSDPNISEPTR
jgi:hypothetical protein